MTAEKKFKTFADLRLISRPQEPPVNRQNLPPTVIEATSNFEEKALSTSTASTPKISGGIRASNNSKNPQLELTENVQQSISPIRDFQKVPNSVTREIMPSGLFKGKSKQVYDYLYSVTRGSVLPIRSIRKSRKEIQKGSGIGSMVTVDAALMHLESIGLIRIRSVVGSVIGNEYEIFTPEESTTVNRTLYSSLPSTYTSIASISRYTSPIQILDDLDVPLSSISSTTETIENKYTSSGAKTLYKTKEENFDDEPSAVFRSFNEKLNEIFKDVTGREVTFSDEQKLTQLGELIAAEFAEAASRTKVVSDPAAFLLTHMRRRLGVRTIKVETPAEKVTRRGTAPTKPIKKEIQLTDDEIQECPDCNGRLLIYPEGPSRGAVMCKHLSLIKAKQEAVNKENKENKE